MKFFRVLLIIVGLLIAVVVVLGLMGPKKFDVNRTRTIQASPEAIWEEVVDFKQWPAWSYWEKMDTTIVNTFSGSDQGVGAIMSWTSQSGPGEMEILEARPHEYMKMEMRMGDMEPSEVEWFFREKEEGTEVEWTMLSGDLPFMLRAMMTLMGGQSSIETAYDEGLADIAEIAEAKPKVSAPDITVVQEVMPAITYMGKRYDDVTMESVQSGTIQGEAFGALMQAIGGPQNMTGAPMCIVHRYDDETQNMDLEYALPIAESMEGSDDMAAATLPEQKVAYYDYMGSYEGLGQAWEDMGMWLAANGLEVAGAPYEVYVTDPGTEPDPSKWITRIVYPVQ